jgi:hypothetical protein
MNNKRKKNRKKKKESMLSEDGLLCLPYLRPTEAPKTQLRMDKATAKPS